jgi:hypothetical protein
MFHRVDLLVIHRWFIQRVVLIKFNLIRPSRLPLIMFGLLLDRLSMNGLVGDTHEFKILSEHSAEKRSI